MLLNEKNKNKSLHNGQQSQTHTVYAATIQTCMLRLIGSVPQQHSLDDDHNFLLYQHFPPFIYQCKWTLSYHQLQMDTVFYKQQQKLKCIFKIVHTVTEITQMIKSANESKEAGSLDTPVL